MLLMVLLWNLINLRWSWFSFNLNFRLIYLFYLFYLFYFFGFLYFHFFMSFWWLISFNCILLYCLGYLYLWSLLLLIRFGFYLFLFNFFLFDLFLLNLLLLFFCSCVLWVNSIILQESCFKHVCILLISYESTFIYACFWNLERVEACFVWLCSPILLLDLALVIQLP